MLKNINYSFLQKAKQKAKALVLGVMLLFFAGGIAKGQNLFTNGSLTGTPGDSQVPTGYSLVYHTNDTSDIHHPGYHPRRVWNSPAVPSPDGGTWVSGYGFSATSGEQFQQTVTGLTIGEVYTFSYYWANTSYNTYTTPCVPNMSVTGMTGMTNPTTPTADFAWEQYTVNLTATSTSATFVFGGITTGASNPWGYMSFDGFSLRPALILTNTCPETTVNLSSHHTATPPTGTSIVWFDDDTHSGTPIADPTAVGISGTYYAFYYDNVNDCYSPPSVPVVVTIEPCSSVCYKPGITAGIALDTKVGITALNRAGATDSDNWPMTRKGGWLALEAKTKAFVPNRVAFSGGNPVGIAPANFVEGMMVYDDTNKCMKMYTQKEGDVSMAWHCISTQTCPD